MHFQRALRSSASKGECRKLGVAGGSAGNPGGSLGLPSLHHLKGAQPQGLSGQSPHSEESNQQKFSPIQMYLEGEFGKHFFDYSSHPFYLS